LSYKPNTNQWAFCGIKVLKINGGVKLVYLLIGMAGALGAILRYSLGVFFLTNTIFPFTTLLINLVGSFLLAWLTSSLFQRFPMPSTVSTAIGTGFVGSFTTFSTLSVETVQLFNGGELLLGILYITASIIGGLWMSRLGFVIGEGENRS
jgi:fluoride exporter